MGKRDKITLPEGTKVPDHIVLMPDGDRRWARARGLSPSEGHKAGMENMIRLSRAARDWGIHTVSAWGLSTENWLERPKEETDFLMKGIVNYLDRYLEEMNRDGVRIVHLGRKDRLPGFLLKKIAEVEEITRKNRKHVFNIGLDYNGWDEMVRATQKIVEEGIPAEKIDRKVLDMHMDTASQPYPYIDLYIRTSGEQRTSGFMMWQADYAEFYWEPEYFPAFSTEKLKDAILDYSRRRRRFGGNDAVEHFKFDPKLVARLEMDFRRDLTAEKVAKYVKEQYGMTKELAKEAGWHLAKALKNRELKEWEAAKGNLKQLYELVRKNVGLALEPEVLANIEVNFWKDKSEEGMKELLAEKFRFSTFQAAKSAHLAVLAEREIDPKKQKGYLEMFYKALKERVA